MRVYLDSCCYNRAIEESEQESMRAESEAINYIIDNREANGDVIIGSSTLDEELDKIPNHSKRAAVIKIYSVITDKTFYDVKEKIRAAHFRDTAGIHDFDSRHLACAESGDADIFLTVDYRLINSAKRLNIRLEVMNPVDYAEARRAK